MDRLYGALLHAGAAVRAEIWVNQINGIALADGFHRANVHTRTAGDTCVGYFVSHRNPP